MRKTKGKYHFIYGALAAGIATCLGQPFDVIKTNMIGEGAQLSIRSPIAAGKDVVRMNGLKGLYRGIVPTTIRVFPAAGLYFYLLNVFREGLNTHVNKGTPLTSSQNFFVGISARSIAAFVFNPILVVKTRFEYNIRSGEQRKVGQMMMDLVRKRQLFSGAISSVFRDAPYAGIMYMLYQNLLKFFCRVSGINDVAVWSMPSSFIATCTAITITHPFDVIRTRIQLSTGAKEMGKEGLANVLRRIYVEDGILGFWRGYVMRVSKKAFCSTICWTLFEIMLNKFHRKE